MWGGLEPLAKETRPAHVRAPREVDAGLPEEADRLVVGPRSSPHRRLDSVQRLPDLAQENLVAKRLAEGGPHESLVMM